MGRIHTWGYFEMLPRRTRQGDLSTACQLVRSWLTCIDISPPQIASDNDNATIVEWFDSRIPPPRFEIIRRVINPLASGVVAWTYQAHSKTAIIIIIRRATRIRWIRI